jgi:hypothetical protein
LYTPSSAGDGEPKTRNPSWPIREEARMDSVEEGGFISGLPTLIQREATTRRIKLDETED